MYYYSLFCLSDDDPSPGFVFIRTGVQTEKSAQELFVSQCATSGLTLAMQNLSR